MKLKSMVPVHAVLLAGLAFTAYASYAHARDDLDPDLDPRIVAANRLGDYWGSHCATWGLGEGCCKTQASKCSNKCARTFSDPTDYQICTTLCDHAMWRCYDSYYDSLKGKLTPPFKMGASLSVPGNRPTFKATDTGTSAQGGTRAPGGIAGGALTRPGGALTNGRPRLPQLPRPGQVALPRPGLNNAGLQPQPGRPILRPQPKTRPMPRPLPRPGNGMGDGRVVAPGGNMQPGGNRRPGGNMQPGGNRRPGGNMQPGGKRRPGGSARPGSIRPGRVVPSPRASQRPVPEAPRRTQPVR